MKHTYTYLQTGLLVALSILSSVSCKRVQTIVEPETASLYVNLLHSGTTENLRAVHFFDVNNGLTVGATGGLYKTTNGGLSWTKTMPIAMDTSKSTIDTTIVFNELYFFNKTTGWILGTYNARTATSTNAAARKTTMLKTTDGGLTWLEKNFDASIKTFTTIKFFDEANGYVIGNGGLVYRTIDGGNTWIKQESGVTSTLTGLSIIGANTALICGTNGVLLKTTNGGVTWEALQTPSRRAFHEMVFLSPELGYVTGGGSNNGGPNDDKAFVYQIDTEGNFIDRTNIYYSVFYFFGLHASADGQNIWTAGHLGQIFRSTDAGKTWSEELSKSQRQETLYDISFPTERVGYFVGNSGVILKVDLDKE